jgi:hypothetical protein
MFSDLTAERCAFITQSLKTSIRHFGLALNPAAPLAAVVKDIEWMASFSAGPMSIGGAKDVDISRMVRALPRVEQAERIAIMLERVRGVPGADVVVLCLKENIDRLSTLHERAQDLLFELEVGGRLAASGFPVSFAEPDIRLDFPTVSIGLPCKRPRSARRIVVSVREAVAQIQRAKLSVGVVVVSIEPIVHPPAPTGGLSGKKPAPKNWVASTVEEADTGARTMVREAVEPLLPKINGLFAKHSELAGVLFCGAFTALLNLPRAYAYRWLNFSVSSPRDTRLTELLGAFVQSNGAKALRKRSFHLASEAGAHPRPPVR